MASLFLQTLVAVCLITKCQSYKVTIVANPVLHGEGVFWWPSNLLTFVDTFNAALYRINLNTSIESYFNLPKHNSIGFVLKKKQKRNEFLIFADRDVINMRPDNKKIRLKKILSIEADKPKNQFNDGKADSKGRIWAGTLTRLDDLSVSPGGGSLYMIDRNLTAHIRLTNVSISNGLAWNKNNTKFYFIDSATYLINEYDYKEETGEIKNPRTVLNITEQGYSGIPDGMTIDKNDHLWIAIYGGHNIIQVDPKEGKVLQTLKMPFTYVTSLIWGGEKYDQLYVSTSKLNLTKEELKVEKNAGSILCITNLKARGLPPNEVDL